MLDHRDVVSESVLVLFLVEGRIMCTSTLTVRCFDLMDDSWDVETPNTQKVNVFFRCLCSSMLVC